MRAYNRGKPFTGLTTALESTPLLKGISTTTARKLQYDVPIYIGTVHNYIHEGTFEHPLWTKLDPEICRHYRNSPSVSPPPASPLDLYYDPRTLRGFAIEVDPPKPEYEPDAQ